MRTPLPKHMRAPPVARFASGILFCDRIWGILADANGDGILAAARFHVGLARTVATLASAGLFRSVRVGHSPSHRGVLETSILILMACNADLGSCIAIAGRRRVLGLLSRTVVFRGFLGRLVRWIGDALIGRAANLCFRLALVLSARRSKRGKRHQDNSN